MLGVQIQAVLSYIFGTLGILGNLVLFCKLLKNTQHFYILVKTLICFDTLFIGLSIAIQSDNFVEIGLEYEVWLYPWIHLAMVGSIYTTILLTLERFWVITKNK